MPVSLQKGQKVSLTKDNPGLKKVVVGLDGMSTRLIQAGISTWMRQRFC